MSSRKQRARAVTQPANREVSPEETSGLFNDRYLLASVLTLAFTLVAQSSSFGPITAVFALAGLGFNLYRTQWFWPAMFVAVLFKFFIGAIFSLDNHSWLYVYWIFTLALYSVLQPHVNHLRTTARLLIGFSFLFATSWKILSPEFRSGSFFTYAGAVEPRLTSLLEMIGLQQSGTGHNNLYYINQWSNANPPLAFQLLNNSSLNGFWMLLTIATIIVEGLVAIAFLAPLAMKWRWLRDAILTAFCIGTYILMPVLGFGHLLCILGYTQSGLEEKKRRRLYVGLMVFIQAMMMRDSLISGITA